MQPLFFPPQGTPAVSEAPPPESGPSRLVGQVALVVGGASGIGLAVAQALGAAGCRLAIAGRNPEKVAEAARQLPSARGYADCDVRRRESIEAVFAHVQRDFGQLDLLVTSAGIARSPLSSHHVPQSVAQLDEAVWDDILDTNLRGVFLATRAALGLMVPRRSGQIVNISSAPATRRGLPYGAGYCASKRAALALLDAAAQEVAPLGIRVFSFLPDVVQTAMIAGTQLDKEGALTPDEVGQLIVELLAEPLDSLIESPGLAPLRRRAWQMK